MTTRPASGARATLVSIIGGVTVVVLVGYATVAASVLAGSSSLPPLPSTTTYSRPRCGRFAFKAITMAIVARPATSSTPATASTARRDVGAGPVAGAATVAASGPTRGRELVRLSGG